MPYADKEKQKAYIRKWSREYARKKRAEYKAMKKEIEELRKKLADKQN